jgi:hypothetical protein
MSDSGDNARRLLRALSTGEEVGDHAACLAALAEFLEAEMADEDVARLFPEVQAHLDICEECDALHTEMLDLLMADELGLIPELDHLPSLRMPREVLVRRWARNAAGAALDALRQSRRDLDSAAEAFFDALAQTPGRLGLQEISLAFGLGESDSEALPFVAAAYYALAGISREVEKTSLDLQSKAEAGQLPGMLERTAREEAERVGLRGEAAQTFARALVVYALSNLAQLADLTKSSPDTLSD